MTALKDSFEDVADWCERHLEEYHGREIGMTFGAMLRAYGQLATMHSDTGKQVMVQATAEQLLVAMSTYLLTRESRAEQVIDAPWANPHQTYVAYPVHGVEEGVNLGVVYDADPPIGPKVDPHGPDFGYRRPDFDCQ